MVGIYIITHNKSFKRYVGQSKDVKVRLRNHFKKLSNGTHENRYLQRAYSKYGRDAFSISIIECSEDMLTPIEQGMLNQWQGLFNICKIANVPPGFKNRKHTEEHKVKVGNLHRGKIVSAETRAKLSAVHKGKKKAPRSAETRAKLSAAKKRYHAEKKKQQSI